MVFIAKLRELAFPVIAAVLAHVLMAALLLSSLASTSTPTLFLPSVPVRILTTIPPELLAMLEPDTQSAPREALPAEQQRLPEPSLAEQTPNPASPAPAAPAQTRPQDFSPLDLQRAIAEEESFFQQIDEDQRAQLYVDKIAKYIERHWSRPFQMNQRMVAKLRIKLVPTGEIVGVTLATSSGSPAFDDSVEIAVRRASPLPVPTDRRLFERYFRSMLLVFDPQDVDI